MDDRDLELLRGFRVDESVPSIDAEDRIDERVLQAVLDEELVRAGSHPRRSFQRPGMPWYHGLVRPLVAAGSLIVLALTVAVMSDGGLVPGGRVGTSAGGVTQAGAGVLDATAATLFGSTPTTPAAADGTLDLSDASDDELALVDGPQTAPSGQLATDTLALVQSLPRDPERLRAMIRSGVVERATADPDDRQAFLATMRWVIDDRVPDDLRATMLRSIGGLVGVDPAIAAVDMTGRSGVVLGHVSPTQGIRDQFLLDMQTATVLEQRSLTTGFVNPACPAGTYTAHELYDESGLPVAPTSAPWMTWPDVVTSCDPSA